AAMSACPLHCLIDSPIAQRFWNLLELLIAFASSSTDRKERRGKQFPKSRSDWHFCACCGPLFDYKLAHVSFQTLFLSMDHLVKVSLKNWYTFLLQKTSMHRKEDNDMQVLYSRCCGLDVHQKTVVACVMITQPNGK